MSCHGNRALSICLLMVIAGWQSLCPEPAVAQNDSASNSSATELKIGSKIKLGDVLPFTGAVPAISFAASPADNEMALVTREGTIEVWDLDIEQKRKQFKVEGMAIARVAYSGDGRRLAAIDGRNGNVAVINIGSEKIISKIERPAKKSDSANLNAATYVYGAQRFAFAHDGDRVLVIGTSDGPVNDTEFQIWDVENKEKIASQTIEGSVQHFTADRELAFVYGTDNKSTFFRLNMQSGETTRLERNFRGTSANVSSQGKILLVSWSGSQLRDEFDGKNLMQPIRNASSQSAAFSADGARAVLVANVYEPREQSDGPIVYQNRVQLVVIDTDSGDVENRIDTPVWPNTVAFSSDGKSIVYHSSAANVINIFDVSSGESMLDNFNGHRGSVRQLKFYDDGDKLWSYGMDYTSKTWDLSSKEETSSIHLGMSAQDKDVSPDGSKVLRSNNGRGISVVDTQTNQVERRLDIAQRSKMSFLKMGLSDIMGNSGQNISIPALNFVQGGQSLVAYGFVYRAQLLFRKWSIDDGSTESKVTIKYSKLGTIKDPNRIYGPSFAQASADGRFMATFFNDRLIVVDFDNRDYQLYENIGPPHAFVRDDTFLICGGLSNELVLLDLVSSQKETIKLEEGDCRYCQVVAGNRAVFTNSSYNFQTIQIRQTDDWKLLFEHVPEDRQYTGVALSETGRRLGLGTTAGQIEVWNLVKK